MPRVHTLDLLRGVVMILMVIDHTQEYQAGPGRGYITDPMTLASTPTLVYFWRILAHFCAPTFALLMGMSAALSAASSRKLAVRGLVLLALEFTLVNWAWTFNPLWHRYFFQVIAALGCSLLALSAARHLPRPALLSLAVLILCGHNLLDSLHAPPHSLTHVLWSILHEKNILPLPGGFEVRTTYPILPILGITFLGFSLAPWLTRPQAPWFRLGLSCLTAFTLLRLTNLYGDPHPFDGSLLSFFNVTKYPLSLQFTLMTLGPVFLFLFLAFARNWTQPHLEQLGRTAFFFYLAHLVLLHALALGAALLLGLPIQLSTRFGGIPDGIGFPVWATAPLALLATALLYPACKWYEPRRLRYL